MNDEYFDALRRTGDAWDAYRDAATSDRGDGANAESKRCEALWAAFQQSIIRLTAMRKSGGYG
jgi:hypothetical protein